VAEQGGQGRGRKGLDICGQQTHISKKLDKERGKALSQDRGGCPTKRDSEPCSSKPGVKGKSDKNKNNSELTILETVNLYHEGGHFSGRGGRNRPMLHGSPTLLHDTT